MPKHGGFADRQRSAASKGIIHTACNASPGLIFVQEGVYRVLRQKLQKCTVVPEVVADNQIDTWLGNGASARLDEGIGVLLA